MAEWSGFLKDSVHCVGVVALFITFGAAICLLLFAVGAKLVTEYINPHAKDESELSTEEIGEFIGVPIPEDAIDIVHVSKRGYGPFIELSFKASPDGAEGFTRKICDGILHQGYNPFDAIDTGQPLSEVHLIKANHFTYYSYSPDAPETYFGNRCMNEGSYHVLLILVDRTNPDLHEIQIELPSAPNTASIPLPAVGKYQNYIRPIPGLPFMVPGMASIDGQYTLVTEEFCIEARSDYVNVVSDRFNYLLGADVEIFIDDQRIASTYITQGWVLAPEGYNESNLPLSPFKTCFFENWERGLHPVTVQITTRERTKSTYSWEFFAE